MVPEEAALFFGIVVDAERSDRVRWLRFEVKDAAGTLAGRRREPSLPVREPEMAG